MNGLSSILLGIPGDYWFNENGFGGGASGDEMDRLDYALGTPMRSY